jgi:polar amino acid transport system substrate-binding protein
MRKVLISAVVAAAFVSACASNSPTVSGPTTSAPAASPAGSPTANCTTTALHLYKLGQLTVATDSPAYPPWFVNNKPSNGKGYESAVAYAVAEQLGFTTDQVKWVVEPFNSSYAPGPKKFDFDVNEISVTPERSQAVTFSDSYYDVTQALVAMKTSKLASAHSPTDLTGYVYGAQVGTTSLAYIQQYIKPTKQPAVFDTTNDAKQALQNHRIDALVLDLPTASFVSADEIKGSTLVGQFPSVGEHFGLLFEKDDPLVTCVNQAIAALRSKGTLQQLQQQYLSDFLKVPTIQP